MARTSVFETREPQWWGLLTKWCAARAISELDRDSLFELVMQAIFEDASVTLGSAGGLKGGKARAASMTARERSDAARKAALARWKSPQAGRGAAKPHKLK